jgi:hypothetical protein
LKIYISKKISALSKETDKVKEIFNDFLKILNDYL